VCNNAGLLIGRRDGDRRIYVARANCDSWRCQACSRRMGERWSFRAKLGSDKLLMAGCLVDFVTITSHEKLATFEQTETVWREAWGSLYNAIKRKQPALAYMIVPERHKDGRMHVHAIWNAGVTQKWLKDNARKRGLGYQCKIIHLSNSSYAARYVTKYICKDFSDDLPAHFRRVRVSRNWADIPKPTTEYDGMQWEYVGSNGALQIVYDECTAKRLTMIDIQTGEYFDDVDLGTIVSHA